MTAVEANSDLARSACTKACCRTHWNFRRAGKLADAARIYEEVLRAEPANFDALHALGIIRYQTGEVADAERLISAAAQARPTAHDAHYNRACLLQKLGRPNDALAAFDRAIAIKPDYIEALVNRAGCCRR
jgi:tetratricopeptide (TPR) repeat protein